MNSSHAHKRHDSGTVKGVSFRISAEYPVTFISGHPPPPPPSPFPLSLPLGGSNHELSKSICLQWFVSLCKDAEDRSGAIIAEIGITKRNNWWIMSDSWILCREKQLIQKIRYSRRTIMTNRPKCAKSIVDFESSKSKKLWSKVNTWDDK